MFGYRKLIDTNSSYNSNILVYSFFGQPRMEIGGLLQSGGIIREIWKKAVNKIQSFRKISTISTPGVKFSETPGVKIEKVLILGLGAGTAVEEIVKKWPEAKITGVEIDPKVVGIGRKYFKLAQFEKSGNLKIIIGDATKMAAQTSFLYSRGVIKNTPPACICELIIVDLYRGKDFVDTVWQKPFLLKLKKLLNHNGIVVFNHLFWGAHKKRAEGFTKLAGTVFPKISLTRTLANLLIFASC